MKMKNITPYFLILACYLFATSCDKGFDEMNINPTALTKIDPALQLNFAIVNSAPVYNNLNYETTIVKQMITPFTGSGAAISALREDRDDGGTSLVRRRERTALPASLALILGIPCSTGAKGTRLRLINSPATLAYSWPFSRVGS